MPAIIEKKGEGGNRTRDTGFADQRITTLLPRHLSEAKSVSPLEASKLDILIYHDCQSPEKLFH